MHKAIVQVVTIITNHISKIYVMDAIVNMLNGTLDMVLHGFMCGMVINGLINNVVDITTGTHG